MQYQIYFQYELILPHDQGEDQVHVKARLIQPHLSILFFQRRTGGSLPFQAIIERR
jgi:hypothetical protein